MSQQIIRPYLNDIEKEILQRIRGIWFHIIKQNIFGKTDQLIAFKQRILKDVIDHQEQ
jgi:hypothetical protein